MNKNLVIKLKESLFSVLPITAIVLILHFTIAPMPVGTLLLFIGGAILLILGMGLFTLGADVAMMPMGEMMGAQLSKMRKLGILIVVCFLVGVVITIAEPDLQVLAKQVPAIPDAMIILAVSLGVGIFLVLAMLRTVFQFKLSYVLWILYALVFGLAIFTSESFLSVAFDSGGVTTGPITVPFIMALGIGVAAVRGGKSSRDDSFGLIALCSIGPILAVMIMGMLYGAPSGGYTPTALIQINNVTDYLRVFGHNFPEYFKHVAIAVAPIVIFFAIFQLIFLKLPVRQLIKMGIGIAYTYIGLVVFLTGVNVGFMPVGLYLGEKIVALSYHWILIPLGMVIGFFIVMAEPAVHVLNNQVEDITGGTITKKAMLFGLAIGVAISLGLAMLRIITGTSIWYFLAPGYAIALILSFFVPDVFTAIAFDSGGVASGPMTATFLLPFAMGVCQSLGGNMMTDAFGIVAMVAMTPLITIQIMGLFYRIKTRKTKDELPEESMATDLAESEEIIDF